MSKTNSKKFLEEFFKLSRCLKEKNFYKNDLTELSILQLHALIYVKEHEHAQMNEIAKHFKIELSSATSLVNKLCTMELVSRETDPQDRRLVRIQLTEKGKKLLQDAMEVRVKKIESMLSSLSEKDTNELLRIMETLNERIEEANL
jgi:DNA-binding MarR family transcriptional regulator